MNYSHDRRICLKRGSKYEIFGGTCYFYLNTSFRKSPVHRPTRKSRNVLGEEDVSSVTWQRRSPLYIKGMNVNEQINGF